MKTKSERNEGNIEESEDFVETDPVVLLIESGASMEEICEYIGAPFPPPNFDLPISSYTPQGK
jgi:hypothetical protein